MEVRYINITLRLNRWADNEGSIKGRNVRKRVILDTFVSFFSFFADSSMNQNYAAL